MSFFGFTFSILRVVVVKLLLVLKNLINQEVLHAEKPNKKIFLLNKAFDLTFFILRAFVVNRLLTLKTQPTTKRYTKDMKKNQNKRILLLNKAFDLTFFILRG